MLETLGRLRDGAGKCVAASAWALSDDDLTVAVQQVHRLEQTLAGVKLRLIAEVQGRDLPGRQNVRDTVTWLGSRLVLDAAVARQLVQQAAALGRHPAVDAALCAGRVSVRHAEAICAAVDALPSPAELTALPDLPADDEWGWSLAAGPGGPTISAAVSGTERDGGATGTAVAAGDGLAAGGGVVAGEGVMAAVDVAAVAEAALLRFAGEFPAGPLRRLGARILDHVAPQVADRLDAIALARAERRAFPQRGFTLSPPAGGLVRIGGHLTVEDAAIVSAALDPLSIPGTDPDARNPAQLRADALIEVCRLALRTGTLPDSGGEPPQLAVTVAYDPLTRQLGVGRIDNGDRVSAVTVRRLACDAQLLPIVLGGAGQVLDAGRSRRLATGPLRRALVVRDRGCAFPQCDRLPRWCDGHHIRGWTAGGPTDL
ncbi:MAG TPA: DUF222 domain-containing protein, partial [Actinoplanes sp.]